MNMEEYGTEEKSYSELETYLGPCQTSMMELFYDGELCNNS